MLEAIGNGINKVLDYRPLITKKITSETKKNISETLELDLGIFFESDLNNSKIKLRLIQFNSREELIDFFDVFFSKYFIKNLNFNNLQNILQNFELVKKNNEDIVIGDEINLLNNDRIKEYKKFIINRFDEIGRIDCIFNRIYISDEKGEEKIFEFNKDEFIAFLFQNGIRSGFDENIIIKGINSKYFKGEIAKNILPTYGIQSTIKSVIKLKIDEQIKEVDDRKKIDMKSNILFFPIVRLSENNGLILIKTKAIYGKDGIKTNGEIIQGLKGEDKYISTILAGESIRIEEDEQYEYFLAQKDGFIEVEYDIYNKSMIRKISVVDQKINKEEIGPKTGNVYIADGENFIQRGPVKFGYELKVEKNLEINHYEGIDGNIISNNGNIKLIGNKIGGKIISLNGNITLEGKALSKAYIEATNGIIEIDYAEHCLIVGKKIKIKNAVGCDIIGDEVEIETSNVCNIITKKSLLISKKMNAELIEKRNGEKRTRDTNIIFLCKKEVIGDAKMLKKVNEAIAFFESERNINRETLEIIQQLNEKAKEFGGEIDQSLEENKNKVFMKLNAGQSIDYIKMYLGDFYESFDITKLNNKGEDLKHTFIDLLLTLFDEAKNIGNHFLTEINIANEGNEKKQVILDFEKIKKITEEEINKGHLLPDNPIEYKPGIENRAEIRTFLQSEKEFKNMQINELGHFDISVGIDIILEKFYGSVKNISSGGMAIFLRKSCVKNNYPHLQKGKLIGISTEIFGQKINLNAIVKNIQESDGILTLGLQFVWSHNPRYIVLNRQIKNKLSSIAMELQRMLLYEKNNSTL